MGCTCQNCGRKYKVDFLVPHEVWEKIKPEDKPKGGGLLCGICIAESIENMGEYDYWFLKKDSKKNEKTVLDVAKELFGGIYAGSLRIEGIVGLDLCAYAEKLEKENIVLKEHNEKLSER